MRWQFQQFELDDARFELRRSGKAVPIAPKPLALLLHLAKRHPASVSRDELQRVLWEGVHVAPGSLSRTVYLARRALGNGEAAGDSIRTVRGRGYAFGPTIQPALVEVAPRSAHSGGPFVGRSSEIQALNRALEGALLGHGGMVLLSGEPGIGKTRLAREFALRAEHTGARALWGRCWEAGGARAFWPWAQIVRGYAREAGADELRVALGGAKATLGHVLPELYEDFNETPPADVHHLDGENARSVLFEAAVGFLARAAARRPLVLLLEDVHAADLPSLLLLHFLTLTVHELPLLVVGTHRDGELRRRPDAAALINDLERDGLSVPLRGLEADDVRRLLADGFAIEVDAERARVLRAMTAGNPFLLGEVARELAASAHPECSGGQSGNGPPPCRARELIRHRLDLLAPSTRQTLCIAALVGQEFGLRLLGAILGVSHGALMDLLREAADDGLIVPMAAGMRYQFQHALVRETLAAELPSTERMARHLEIGQAIEALHGPHADAYVGALAHHFVQAAPAGGADRAARYAEAAGRRELAVLAYEAAALHFQTALATLEFQERPDPVQRCELLLALGTSRQKASDIPGSQPAFDEAATLARSLGRPDLFGRAALGAAPWFTYGRPGGAVVQRLEDALTALPSADSPLRVELLARLAHMIGGTGTRAGAVRAIAAGREALQMGLRLREDRSLARALFAARWTDWDPGTYADRIAITAELRAVATRLDDRELAVLGEGWHFVDSLEGGDPVEADAALARHAALAAELRQPEHLWWNAVWRATCAIMEGRYADAEPLLDRSLSIGASVDQENTFLVAFVQRSQILFDRGEVEQPLGMLEAIVAERRDTLEGDPHPTCRRIEALVELGRAGDTRADFDRLAAKRFAALPPDMRYGVNLASCAVAAAALGEVAGAATLYSRLRPAAGRNLCFGPGLISAGPASRYQGLLAATMGRDGTARRHFEHALSVAARMGWRPLAARTQCDYAAMLLRCGGRGDRQRARRLLDEAIETAARLGLARVESRARALRRRREFRPRPR